MTQVLITIDTELSIQAHKAGGSLEDNVASAMLGECREGAFGVGYQARTLAQAGLVGTFFVDPMPCALFGVDWLRRVVDLIRSHGQDVQLHAHPGWLRYVPAAQDWRAVRSDDIGDYDVDTQTDLIARARAWLVAAGAPEPVAFRAGNYGADDRTLEALARLGIRWDSSFNPAGERCRIGLPAGQVAVVERGGVFEVPISAIDTRGGLRFAQVNALSAWETRAAMHHAQAAGHKLFTIVTHSFELLNRARTRANRTVVARWQAMLDHLRTRRAELPTSGFAALDAVVGAGQGRLATSQLRAALRQGGQALAQWRYEGA